VAYDWTTWFVAPDASAGWSVGGFGAVDEFPADDADFCRSNHSSLGTSNPTLDFDLSAAPGENEGWRLYLRMRATNADGYEITPKISLVSTPFTFIWTGAVITMTNTAFEWFIIDITDADMSGAQDYRLTVSAKNLRAGNNSLHVAWARLTKSPFTTAQKESLPSSLTGQAFHAYTVGGVALLGPDEGEDIEVIPDISGNGEHLFAQTTNYCTYISNVQASGEAGLQAHASGSRYSTFKPISARWTGSFIYAARIQPDVLPSANDPPMFTAPAHWGGTVLYKPAFGLSDNSGPVTYVLMFGGGDPADHKYGGTPVADEWHWAFAWQQEGGNDHAWVDDGATPLIDSSSGDNDFAGFTAFAREDNTRFWSGWMGAWWVVEGTGVTEADIDAARDEWVNGPGGTSVIKVQNETAQVSEASLSPLGLARLQSETTELSEGDLRFLGLTRVENEALQVSEIDLRLLGLTRIQNETEQISEEVLRALTLVRLQHETVQISEADLSLLGLTRVEGETVQTSETDLYYRGVAKIENETVQVSETDLRFLGRVKVQDESLQISEEDLHFLGLVRVQDEVVQITEADLRFLDIIKLVAETVQIAEEDLRFLALLRLTDETLQVVEDEIAVRGLVRQITETEQISEEDLYVIVTGGVAIIKVQNETIQISETDLHLLGIVAIQTETLNVSETVDNTLGLRRVVAETLNVSESDLQFRTLVRVQDETIQLSEIDLTTRDIIRIQEETLQLVEQILRTQDLIRLEGETVQITEDELSLRGLLQLESETLQISEVDLHFASLSTAPVIIHATIELISKPKGAEVISGFQDAVIVSGPMNVEVLYDND
jgi:hypothetical protein